MLCRVRFLPLAIPFVQEFSHAQKTRAESDAFFLELTDKTGLRAYGEALARPYVTGETRTLVSRCLRDFLPDFFAEFPWEIFDKRPDLGTLFPLLQEQLDRFCEQLPAGPLVWNGLRCVLELALLDLWLARHRMSLAELLPPRSREVSYSGILSAGDQEKTLRAARHFTQLGIFHLKLKISSAADRPIIEALLAQGGDRLSLRLDANSAFEEEDATAFVRSLAGLPIQAIEQPLPRGDVPSLGRLQATTSIPLMADESLLTLDDARELVAAKACGVFNIRLAKNGGLGPSLQLAAIAQKAGLAIQIGAMVGETALLSAVGRHLAAYLAPVLSVEGSFGSLLLQQDMSRQSIRFGFGGRAQVLKGPRFGIDIWPERLESFLVSAESWEMSL